MVVNASVLDKYRKHVHITDLRTNKEARRETARLDGLNRYVSTRKPTLLLPVRFKGTYTTENVFHTGENISMLSKSRLDMIKILDAAYLYPPDGELNLEGWLRTRLAQLAPFVKDPYFTGSLQSWLSLPSKERGRAIAKFNKGADEIDDLDVADQERVRVINAQLEADEQARNDAREQARVDAMEADYRYRTQVIAAGKIAGAVRRKNVQKEANRLASLVPAPSAGAGIQSSRPVEYPSQFNQIERGGGQPITKDAMDRFSALQRAVSEAQGKPAKRKSQTGK